LNWTTQQDHQNMMEQLGIQALRPGPSGRAGAPNSANYDPEKANPFPDLPDALTLKSGEKVTTAEMWWKQRRPEIIEDFEREVVGRVPKDVPKVTWKVETTVTDGRVGELPANGKQLIGQVDNSGCPSISVEIRMTVVTPAKVKGQVPVLMMFGGFGGGGMPRAADAPPPANPPREFGGPFKDPPSTQQLLAAGWGYATISPGSIQADNGAGLTKGIIGLVNKGQARKPDDWGSLRAWAWGAARGLDYLETDPTVDAKRVGIEGVSRFGKAALVTLAFEPRFAVALVGSSGEGGAKLHRRNFGEAGREPDSLPASTIGWRVTFSSTAPRKQSSAARTLATFPWTLTNSLRCARRAQRSLVTACRNAATRSGSTNRAATWRQSRPARSSACSA
jgi:hypothetical protein